MPLEGPTLPGAVAVAISPLIGVSIRPVPLASIDEMPLKMLSTVEVAVALGRGTAGEGMATP